MTQTRLPPPALADARAPACRRARLLAPREWTWEGGGPPGPGRGQIRVVLEGCGVCASSLPSWQGRPWFDYPLAPGQLGHEGWGRIEATGPGVSPSRVGERVALAADGAFATHLCVAAEAAVPLPASLADRPVPLEPLGCAVNVLRRAALEPGEEVALLGVGFLGALLLQLLRAAGCAVDVVAHRPYAQALAARLGARTIAPWGERDRVFAALGERPVAGYARVIEATGRADALALASALVAPGGRLLIAGYHQDGPRTVDLQDWNWKGIDVINAHERDDAVIRAGLVGAVEALTAGAIDLSPLLTHCYRPEELGVAFRHLEERPDGFLKGWVRFPSTACSE
jgi:threonine dehydrogenase-like Zn-dependent dehydrogenase